MEKYSLGKGCPKCGNNSTKDQYKKATREGMWSEPEKIHRICLNCGYDWDTLTMDAEKK